MISIIALQPGDRIVLVDADGEWSDRTGWNRLPARVMSVSVNQWGGSFTLERYNLDNTSGGNLVGRDCGTVWPLGIGNRLKSGGFAQWALAREFGYVAKIRAPQYSENDKLGRGYV